MLGLDLSLSIRPVSTAGRGMTLSYYVDSTAVSSGDGSKSSPFKDLTDLPGLVAGDSVGLKYGSTWVAQSIVSSEDRITVIAYGDPNDGLPFIDADGTEAHCIALTGADETVREIHCARATDNNGCIYIPDGLIAGCLSEEGTLHTLLIGNGLMRDTTVNNGTGASLVEVFTTVNGSNLTAYGNLLKMDVYDPAMAGLDFHTSGGGVAYQSVVSEQNIYQDLGSGLSGDDCAVRYSTNDIFNGCLMALTISGDAVITNPTDRNGVATGVFMSINASDATVILDGGTICRDSFNTSVIISHEPGLIFTAKGPVKIGANSLSIFTVFFFDYGDITIGEAGVTQEYDTANIPYIGIIGRGANNATLSTPGNYIFSSATFKLEINGATYNDLDEMKTAGYFLNSMVGTVTACA